MHDQSQSAAEKKKRNHAWRRLHPWAAPDTQPPYPPLRLRTKADRLKRCSPHGEPPFGEQRPCFPRTHTQTHSNRSYDLWFIHLQWPLGNQEAPCNIRQDGDLQQLDQITLVLGSGDLLLGHVEALSFSRKGCPSSSSLSRQTPDTWGQGVSNGDVHGCRFFREMREENVLGAACLQ